MQQISKCSATVYIWHHLDDIYQKQSNYLKNVFDKNTYLTLMNLYEMII